MRPQKLLCSSFGWAALASALLLFTQSVQAQSTPANTKIEVLGTGNSALLLSPLTDPNNDGLDAAGGATDPSWDWADITSSIEPDFEGGENSFNVFDHKVDGGGNNKWCCDDPTADNPVWVAVKFKQVVSLTYFTVTSGNDSPDRDPIDWAIQGSNDATTWTDIYHFKGDVAPWVDRLEVDKFTLPGPSAPYSWIRYIAYDTPGSLHQVSEIEYFGILGGANQSDTDNDGMPNDWETQHGLNPNDPSDAAKDCNGNGLTNLQEYNLGFDPCDTTKPAIVSGATSATFDTIAITFSKNMDAATVTNLANYTISPALAITAASFKGKTVTLTTAKQTAGATAYTVTLKGVKDTANWEIPAGSNTVTVYSYFMTKNGVLKYSYYGSAFGNGDPIDGTPVSNLTDDPRYPNSPNAVGAVYRFNSRDFFPDDSHETYGATMEGYLTPTETAQYRFFVYSDDASELWLSTDDKEANLAKIAEETGCCNNFTEPGATHEDMLRTSDPISLTAGKKYFIRMLYKEGGGGDYGLVAWRKEGDTTPAANLPVIGGKYLSAAIDLPYPPNGIFASQSPASNATGVRENAEIRIVHTDGNTPWTAANVTVKLDGVAVTPTFTKDSIEATIVVPSTGNFASGSVHTITLGYPDAGGKPATTEWSFTVRTYAGPVKDSVKGIGGYLIGNAKFTADKGGRSGAAGDYAIDFGKAGNAWIDVVDATFLNDATKNDTLSFAFWVYRYDINASSAFWAYSTTAGGGRGFQAHTPWSDDTIYFDTAGCCDAATQRINAGIADFPGYTGDDTWWNKWHQFVFTKKADQKNIYIDGQLFLNGSSTGPLGTNFTELAIGTDGIPGADMMHGMIDDFAVFSSEVSAADAAKLASGTSPKTLANLIAYWDFNTVPVVGGSFSNVSLTSDRKSLTLTFTGTLQQADVVEGPYTAVANATSPATIPVAGSKKFYRVQ